VVFWGGGGVGQCKLHFGRAAEGMECRAARLDGKEPDGGTGECTGSARKSTARPFLTAASISRRVWSGREQGDTFLRNPDRAMVVFCVKKTGREEGDRARASGKSRGRSKAGAISDLRPDPGRSRVDSRLQEEEHEERKKVVRKKA